MSRGTNLHRTEEGRKKLNFTKKLKENQDKKQYQKNQNKERNNGDIVFMAISIGDYEIMSGNMQELRRYIREVQEVIVYYRNVTINDKPAVGAQVKVKD